MGWHNFCLCATTPIWFLFLQVISENHFSEGGALQFNFDMTRNLFPIIGKYSKRPENFLKM